MKYLLVSNLSILRLDLLKQFFIISHKLSTSGQVFVCYITIGVGPYLILVPVRFSPIWKENDFRHNKKPYKLEISCGLPTQAIY